MIMILVKLFITKSKILFNYLFVSGHDNSAYHIATLEKILNYSDKIQEGSIIVGSRDKDKIKIRIRYVEFD